MSARRATLVSLLAAAAGAAIALGACESSSTPPAVVTDAASDDADAAVEDVVAVTPDGGRCPLPGSFGSAKCNECVSQTCCEELAACSANPWCKGLMSCILGCLDVPDAGGCARDCFQRFPDDAGAWEAFDDCWNFKDPCRFHCAVAP